MGWFSNNCLSACADFMECLSLMAPRECASFFACPSREIHVSETSAVIRHDGGALCDSHFLLCLSLQRVPVAAAAPLLLLPTWVSCPLQGSEDAAPLGARQMHCLRTVPVCWRR